jgi:hypothetical protein
MSNKELKRLVATLERDITFATSSDDILRAAQKAKNFRRPLVYNHKQPIAIGGAASLIALIWLMAPTLGWSFLPRWDVNGNEWVVFTNIIFIIIAIFCFSRVFLDNRKVAQIAKLAFQKDALLDNNLRIKAPFNAQEMQIRFAEFDRGNYKRLFKQVIGGEYKGEFHTFTFDYYHFHYVDKRTETYVTSSNGRTQTRTRTVYDKFDRYGLIIPFKYAKSLQIYRFKPPRLYPQSYSTGSLRFDKLFTVRSVDEMQAAKFFKPAVVVALEEVANLFQHLNIEIDATGLMCFSFANKNMIMGNQRYDFTKPVEFYDELAGQTKLRLLDRALRTIEQVLRHSDSNF